jgi:hypothetical protein
MHLVSPADRPVIALGVSGGNHGNHLTDINLDRTSGINRDYLLSRASRTCGRCGANMA